MLQRGVLRGFESTNVTLSFAPLKRQTYDARAALLLLPPSAVAAATAADTAAVAATAGGSSAGPPVLSITAAGVEVEQARLDSDQTAAVESQEAAPPHFDSSSAEKLILTVVAEATQGALRVDPSNVSFGVVNVGHAQRRQLSLINQSSGILRYSVELVDEFPEGVDRTAAACEFGTVTAALLATTAGNEGRPGLQDCWVDEPEGLVSAR